jgi:hypothetical protein
VSARPSQAGYCCAGRRLRSSACTGCHVRPAEETCLPLVAGHEAAERGEARAQFQARRRRSGAHQRHRAQRAYDAGRDGLEAVRGASHALYTRGERCGAPVRWPDDGDGAARAAWSAGRLHGARPAGLTCCFAECRRSVRHRGRCRWGSPPARRRSCGWAGRTRLWVEQRRAGPNGRVRLRASLQSPAQPNLAMGDANSARSLFRTLTAISTPTRSYQAAQRAGQKQGARRRA